MKHTYYKITALFIFLFIFLPKITFGAEFIPSSSVKNVNTGDQFEVNLLLDTQGETANAVGGTITYPTDLLQLKEIRDGNSLVNFWVDKPTDTANGIIFSGITPGGYTGQSGSIMSLIFTAKRDGQGSISIKNGELLRNDGTGSAIPFTISNFQFSVAQNTQNVGVQVPAIKDIEAPESFVPEVGRDQNLFDGKWFVAFVAEDKGSGIAAYEVKETRSRIFDLSKWTQTDSPYLLSDQDLHSYIYVKAIDKSGNEKIERVSPKYPLPFYENLDDWSILITIIAFLWLYKKLIWKKHKK